jgi:acetylglutamate kinase
LKVVVKIGGTLLEDAAGRARMGAMLAEVFPQYRALVVHGGGKQLTGYLERLGVASEFLNGLRVTSPEALDGVIKVFAGTVNHQLLAALHAAGVRAVGISGIDGGCLAAEPLRGPKGESWGLVGKITGASPQVWDALIAADLLPVMAPLGVGKDGQIYNVNADQAAVACAVHWKADALIFLTDVDGVRDAAGKILPRIAGETIPTLLASGAVTGGMMAKLNAVEEALAGGLSRVVIANGRAQPDWESLFSGKGEGGTVIVSPLAETASARSA